MMRRSSTLASMRLQRAPQSAVAGSCASSLCHYHEPNAIAGGILTLRAGLRSAFADASANGGVVSSSSSPAASVCTQQRRYTHPATPANTSATTTAAEASTSSSSSPSTRHANGMSFAAAATPINNNKPSLQSSPGNDALVQVDYHVTAWYRPEPFDMAVAYNVIQQLARRQEHLVGGGGGGGNTSQFPPIRITCSFPTLPSTYMNPQQQGSSSSASNPFTPPPFVTSPLLSHVEFLCVTMYMPVAQLMLGSAGCGPVPNYVREASGGKGGLGGSVWSVASAPVPRSFLSVPSTTGGNGGASNSATTSNSSGSTTSTTSPLKMKFGTTPMAPTATSTSSQQTSSSPYPSSSAPSEQVPLLSFAGTPAPVGTEPMTFIIFQEGTIVGWNAPWSEMLTLRNLLTVSSDDVAAEAARLGQQQQKQQAKGSSGAATAQPSIAAQPTAARALWSLLSRAPIDTTTGVVGPAVPHRQAVGGGTSPDVAVVGVGGGPASSSMVDTTGIPLNDMAAADGTARPSSFLRSSYRAINKSMWSVVSGFTSMVTPASMLPGVGSATSAATAGGGSNRTNSSNYLHDKFGAALNVSSTALGAGNLAAAMSGMGMSSSIPSSSSSSFYSISSGIDTMRFNYFERYANADAAAHERRMQLEESGDLVHGGDYVGDAANPSAAAAANATVPPTAVSSPADSSSSTAAASSSPSLIEVRLHQAAAGLTHTPANPDATTGEHVVVEDALGGGPAVSSPAVTADAPSASAAGFDTTSAEAAALLLRPRRNRTPLSMRNFVDADKDYIVLADNRDHFKVPFSYALAQSVKLDALDHSISPISSAVKTWQQSLAATGTLSFGVRSLRKTKTRLLSLVEALNFKNHVQTTPKVFWSGELQFVRNGYKDACEHLEIEDRRELLQQKMDTVDESLTYLHDEVHANTMEFLTWVIILLIAFEIAVAFGFLNAMSVAWAWLVGRF